MISANIDKVEMLEGGYEGEPNSMIRFGFLIGSINGSQTCTSLLFEIPEGHTSPAHADSADEVAFVLQGNADVTIGDQTVSVGPGDIAQLPRMVPHTVKNTGQGTVRLLTFLPTATVSNVFEKPIWPLGTRMLGSPDWLVATGVIPAPGGAPA
jgi:quercetin dioxygenase-like cupin family protein